MLIGFLDDSSLVVDEEDAKPDIFVFGGYFIRQEQLHGFQKSIEGIKRSYDMIWYAPVKWNMKDNGLRDFYQSNRYLDRDAYPELIKKSDAIRCDLLSVLQQFQATIFISARYDISNKVASNSDYYRWAFENLIQRVGLMCRTNQTQECESSSVTIIVDWPPTGVDKSLFDTYMGGYHYGMGFNTSQTYFSGPLRQFRFSETIFHGSTLHSGPLQIADLVVGCCKDFLYWAITGKRINKIRGIFDVLVGSFYVDERGRLNDCGFKIAKGGKIDVEAKIREYQFLGLDGGRTVARADPL